MKAICVLYGGRLESEAFEKVFPADKNEEKASAFSLALAAASRFPGVFKTVFLGIEGKEYPELSPDIERVLRPSWTLLSLMEELSRLCESCDFTYFAWADCPLLDPLLAASLAERHNRYAAEYSYADGWPYGFAPEILAKGTAGILAKLVGKDDAPVERDALFQIIQKDINAFDIETEISPVDLRSYRLTLAADSKRNLLLLFRLKEAGLNSAKDAEDVILNKPELLRTLPAFFNIQVLSSCPQACRLCPWPLYSGSGTAPAESKEFMPREVFVSLLDKIAFFAGDAVIDLSLWGELALHPEKEELISMVLARPSLSLVIETSGIGWKEDELKALASAALAAAPRKNHMAPLSWIVSLDAHDPARYREIRGAGFSEAQSSAKTLLSLFPNDAYVQAVRVMGFEDDIEHFYRYWKTDLPEPAVNAGNPAAKWSAGGHIIIQKYDDFAGALPKLQATDLSPIKRHPCWHIMRDVIILLDGRTPCCREDLEALKGSSGVLGNAITEELQVIWERGAALYQKHCKAEYPRICTLCDEYYTYNF
jgi:spiro-SPASM protein